MPLIDECERRLRHGIPLRLDQQVGLLEQGYDVGAIEEQINDELEEGDELIKQLAASLPAQPAQGGAGE